MGVLHNPIAPLTADEWTTVEQLCKILQPFEQLSVEVSAEENVTISKIILLAHNLQAACVRMKTVYTSAVGQALLDTLISNLDRRFNNVERNMGLAVAAFLDPRFKRNAFRDNAALAATKEEIQAEIRRMERADQAATTSESAPDQQPSCATIANDDDDLLWGAFDSMVAKAQPNPTSTAIIELRRYNEEDIIPRRCCPMEWWKTRALVYPHLVKIAKKHACMMATSVPCERVFSKSGQLLNDRRSRLKATHTCTHARTFSDPLPRTFAFNTAVF